MRNIKNKLMNAWYQMLNGQISVPVYRVDAPPDYEGHYVLLRYESSTYDNNNRDFVDLPVIITEVVTKFPTRIDDGLSADIDDEIAQLLMPSIGHSGLPPQEGIHIVDVRRLNATEIQEDDGTFRYLTLATRNVHRVVQYELTS